MKFGQYELLARIAVGGMAEVYEGRVVGAEGFEKHVAIKRILPDLAEDERFVKMLLTEARIHSALSHRNIVQIHDLGISGDGEYFIVLEFVEGYDLRVIQEQVSAAGEILPEALSLHIAAEVAQGLHFAHEMRGADGQPLGMVHRDVSPSNVLISMAGEVKLSDFGLAKRRHDRSFIGSLKGNLAYMSPEQAKQAALDRRTDIFSLGAVLFELLTGKRLRDITDELVSWNQVALGAVPSAREVRPDLPESFERVLARALAVDPEQRFPDAASFGAALRELLAEINIPVGASDVQALLGMIKPARRPPSLLERSKVIRLGPEADALHEVIAAPATPPPELVATPPPPELVPTPPPAGRLGAVTPPARTATPRTPSFGGPATPPAKAPSSPTLQAVQQPGKVPSSPTLQAVQQPGKVPSSPTLQAVQQQGKPFAGTLMGFPTAPAGMTSAFVPTPRGLAPPTSADAEPETPPPTTPLPPVRQGHSPGPTPPARGHAPDFARAPTLRASEFPSAVPAHQPAWQGSNGYGSAPHYVRHPPHPPQQPHQTARVQLRSGGAWRPIMVLVAAAVIVGAWSVHLTVIPLEVLFTWNRPAAVYVASEPDGAAVKIDGVAMADRAPARAEIRRDRREHILEVTHPGYVPAREVVRFDRSAVLSFMVRLEKDPTAAPKGGDQSPPPPAPTTTTD